MYRLIRWDKPTGSILLLGPTLAALWAASLMAQSPRPLLWALFIIGAVAMRSLGCIINDVADRHWDGAVPRTADRPLVTGQVTLKQAFSGFVVLAFIALAVVLATNLLTVLLAVPALLLAIIYPYTKRWCGFPQWVLGCAYASGTILAYSATLDKVPLVSVWLFVAAVFWMVATDTIYALEDLPYDKPLGIRSFAQWLGPWVYNGIALCQLCMLVCLFFWGIGSGTTPYFKWILALIALDCVYQQRQLRKKASVPLALFKHNAYLSFGFFVLAVFGLS